MLLYYSIQSTIILLYLFIWYQLAGSFIKILCSETHIYLTIFVYIPVISHVINGVKVDLVKTLLLLVKSQLNAIGIKRYHSKIIAQDRLLWCKFIF